MARQRDSLSPRSPTPPGRKRCSGRIPWPQGVYHDPALQLCQPLMWPPPAFSAGGASATTPSVGKCQGLGPWLCWQAWRRKL